MSCSSIDLKAYLLGEAGAVERRAAEEHLKSCASCQEEQERLRLTQAALLTLREEEIPRRIAFVSDKVFEPRWYQRLWQSGPRLGFAGAAMLSCAILVHAFYQPAATQTMATAPPPSIQTVDVNARVEAEVARRLDDAVQKAVIAVEERQARRTADLLAASEKRMQQQQEEIMAAVNVSFGKLQERVNYLSKQQWASAELGASQ
jgi:hypothetical protein